jgi:hypothetical protein
MPQHRLLPRPAAIWALDTRETPKRAYKPTTPLQLLDAVTRAVAGTQATQGCHNRHTLPGGRSRSCSQKLGLLCRCYLRPTSGSPSIHLPYVHRHLTRIACLALHDGCAMVKPFSTSEECHTCDTLFRPTVVGTAVSVLVSCFRSIVPNNHNYSIRMTRSTPNPGVVTSKEPRARLLPPTLHKCQPQLRLSSHRPTNRSQT